MVNKDWLKNVLIIGALLFTVLSPTYAQADSISDCLDGTVDCPEFGENTVDNESDQSNVESMQSGTGSLILSFLKTGLALLLILALIYGMVKVLGKRNNLFQQTKTLENLGGISVGPNKSIQMIRVGDKFYLIGVGENIELIDEISDESVKKELIHKSESQETQGHLFTSILNRFQQRKNSPSNENRNEFKNLFSNELNKLKESREKAIKTHRQKEDHYE